ncbi:hypothetical protein ILUMI_03687, partial [Ignelater luminosus]
VTRVLMMADSFVKNLLRDWNLSELTEFFEKEGIDEEAFQLLDDAVIESLIPTIGLRLKFQSKYVKYTNFDKLQNWESASTLTLSPSSHLGERSSGTFIINDNVDIDENSIILMPPPLPASISIPMISDQNEEAVQTNKRIRKSIFLVNLESFLRESVEGRLILPQKSEGLLDNNSRNKLCKLIISKLVNTNICILPTILNQIANEIVELFAKERTETYYIPYKPKTVTSPKMSPKGKLYSQYVNLTSSLKNLKLDFKKLHKLTTNGIESWPQVAQAVMTEIVKKKVKVPFDLNTNNIGLLQEKLEGRKNTLYKNNSTLQPFFLCVGELHSSSSYVVIDDVKYQVDDPVKALDITFKCFHTLNLKYPLESARVAVYTETCLWDRYSGGQPQQCAEFDDCNRSFSSLNSYRKHLLRIHFHSYNEQSNSSATSPESISMTLDSNDRQTNVNSEDTFSNIYDNLIDVNSFITLLKDEALQFDEFKVQLLSALKSVIKLFDTLHTEHNRFKLLKQSGNFIELVNVAVGQRLELIGQKTVQKSVTVQYISISEILKRLFELPNVFEETMDYVNKLHSQKDVISNVLQNEHWKNKVSSRPKSDTIIPLYLYFDEFETGNALGAHASIHKVGAIYVSIPCLPPIQQSSLINISLLMLFHSSDLQHFGSSTVFAKLLDELNHLERRGLLIEAGEANINLFFAVALITGDNLGLNSMLGFTKSFRAKFFCRFCKCPRSETQIQYTQSLNLLRNIQNYELDVEVKDVRLTGIKSPCVWNNFNAFHVTTNLAVDIMHDIFEGVGNFDIRLMLNQFINVDKVFTLSTSNSRIKYFKYGCEVKNKPPLISGEDLRNKNIKMSASEMKCFILCLGLLIGDLIPRGNCFWQLYIKLKEVVLLVLAKHVTIADHILQESLIEEHHAIIINTFRESLKPKHHFMVHYPFIMKPVGPLVNMWSMRFESKHRVAKGNANVVASRIDICKALAVKNQLKLCNRFIYNVVPNFNELVMRCGQSLTEFMDNIVSVKRVTVQSTTYQIQDIICTDLDCEISMPVEESAFFKSGKNITIENPGVEKQAKPGDVHGFDIEEERRGFQQGDMKFEFFPVKRAVCKSRFSSGWGICRSGSSALIDDGRLSKTLAGLSINGFTESESSEK